MKRFATLEDVPVGDMSRWRVRSVSKATTQGGQDDVTEAQDARVAPIQALLPPSAIPGRDADHMAMPFTDAVEWVKRAGVILIGWGLVTGGFSWLHLSWVLYGAVTGLAAGLLAGGVVISTIPQKLQLAAVGAITGMGVDWVASLGQKDGPKTAINTLATAIANAIAGITSAAETTSLPVPPPVPVAYGLWCFVFGLGLVMLLGSMQKHAK